MTPTPAEVETAAIARYHAEQVAEDALHAALTPEQRQDAHEAEMARYDNTRHWRLVRKTECGLDYSAVPVGE